MSSPVITPARSTEERLADILEEIREWELAGRLLASEATQHRNRCEYYAMRLECSTTLAFSAVYEAHALAEASCRQLQDEARVQVENWRPVARALKKKLAEERAIDVVGGLEQLRDALAP